MTVVAFAPFRQSLRALDDAELTLQVASASAALAAIEERRIALKWSKERLCAGASVNRRTYDRALSGRHVPLQTTIRSLFRELDRGEKAPRRRSRTQELELLFAALCQAAAHAFDLDPDAVLAVDPQANRPRDVLWLALVRAKHCAAYALVTTDLVPMTEAAALVGVSKQAISQAMRDVEWRRSDAGFEQRLAKVTIR